MTIRPFGRGRLTGAADVVVVGAGHSGLAMSRQLSRLAIDHVVLERGEVANSWRHERWDSLRLLTPNWQSRLPDYTYDGADPDGFMTMPEVVDFVTGYARFIAAPVRTGVRVSSVTASDDGYLVETDRGLARSLGGDCERCARCGERTRVRRGRAVRGAHVDGQAVPEPGPAR